ncbi:MAG: phosphopantetheine-binding protein [Archangium sp.]
MSPELSAWLNLRAEFLSRVRRVLIEELHVQRAPEEIDPDAPLFGTGLGLDSVDAVELVVSLETEFGFRLDDESLARPAMRTVNTLVDVVMKKVGQSHVGPGASVIAAVASEPSTPFETELRAIRTTTALCETSVTSVLRLTGNDAHATLDKLCPGSLALQDTQLRPTVLLREDGTVLADGYVGRDDEKYLLLVEGLEPAQLEAWVLQHRVGTDVQLTRFDTSHRLLSLHGPWAWELLSACLGPDVIGMPYLTLMRGENGLLCFRTGKTGEFGYELMVPNDGFESLRDGLLKQGAEWDVRVVSQAALDHCSLENWFYDVRHEGHAALGPLELGLQWRVSPKKKNFVGAAAYLARKATERVTCVVAEAAIAKGAVVSHGGQNVGRVLHAVRSPSLGKWVAMAALQLPLAVPGIGELSIDGVKAQTTAPPVLTNRSLFVSPQRHTYAERDAVKFPAT